MVWVVLGLKRSERKGTTNRRLPPRRRRGARFLAETPAGNAARAGAGRRQARARAARHGQRTGGDGRGVAPVRGGVARWPAMPHPGTVDLRAELGNGQARPVSHRSRGLAAVLRRGDLARIREPGRRCADRHGDADRQRRRASGDVADAPARRRESARSWSSGPTSMTNGSARATRKSRGRCCRFPMPATWRRSPPSIDCRSVRGGGACARRGGGGRRRGEVG